MFNPCVLVQGPMMSPSKMLSLNSPLRSNIYQNSLEVRHQPITKRLFFGFQ